MLCHSCFIVFKAVIDVKQMFYYNGGKMGVV